MMGQINNDVQFLQWVLPRLNYRWAGFRKPRGQVIKRIRKRMHELGLSGGYGQYRIYLENHPAEWDALDKLFDVTISKFFRDRAVWDYLRDSLMKNLLRSNQTETLNIWSAGCCNGEEPYSIAMAYEMIAGEVSIEKPCSILASDRNAQVLERAKQGVFSSGPLRELSDDEIHSFFKEINKKVDVYRIHDRLRRHIEFEQRDIRDSLPGKIFDIIFCRNLAFTYFSQEGQQEFLSRLKSIVRDGGYFIIGSNEELPENDWLEHFQRPLPVYRKI